MSDRLLTVAELADWLAVERSFVYEHAAELGALRLGTGPRARLRFDLDEVRQRLAGGTSCSVGKQSEPENPTSRAAASTRRRRPMGTSVQLLPIRGRIGAS
jgi:hypothetical protein